ncbi:MAG TPA: LacI family DNA-binding transcriptional regulator [Phycisphaerae bacterium]|nr:LacI family DNA-binding transcriptional regulator [Phycisphaerae bacterium]
MSKERPTLHDVARLSGVTPATVSRVLNKKKKFSASEAVRGRILAAAESLGYAPDLAARSLHRQSSQIIGVFTSPQTHVAEGINEMLLEGIAEVLHASEYDVFFNLTMARRHAVPFWRFDGAILLQSPPSEMVDELDRRRVPYVCVNERVGKAVAQVLADDRMGMRKAVEHLHQLGHRRIAYANARATYLTHYSVAERHETLLETIREFGMELIQGHDVPFCSGTDFLRGAVKMGKATAVITYDHPIAVTILGSAYAMDLRIPRDFSLICFNDVFPVSLLPPPLTAIGVSGREMGRTGAGLLLNRLNSPETTTSAGEIRVAEELVVRRSTAPPGFGEQ